MKLDDVLTLARAGYSANQIAQFAQLEKQVAQAGAAQAGEAQAGAAQAGSAVITRSSGNRIPGSLGFSRVLRIVST